MATNAKRRFLTLTASNHRASRDDTDVPIPKHGLSPASQEGDHILFYVSTRCRPDKQVGKFAIVGRE